MCFSNLALFPDHTHVIVLLQRALKILCQSSTRQLRSGVEPENRVDREPQVKIHFFGCVLE